MNKRILFICSILLLTMQMNADYLPTLRGVRVSLNVYYKDPELAGNMPQSLVQIPTVSIENGILYFYDDFSTTVPVFVVDASNNVVFSATLYSGEDKKVLPASLSGTYTLYMRVGTIMYSAVITI